jgi:hypothetical protein
MVEEGGLSDDIDRYPPGPGAGWMSEKALAIGVLRGLSAYVIFGAPPSVACPTRSLIAQKYSTTSAKAGRKSTAVS